ncbi:N-acetylmuramoyl-L-alanine amidase [Candidatus Pelagibacter sp.]|nr:N-acetylmuramoyl-L-alanine amidase [Candidatus Pelagibacter sp.]
MKKVFNYSLNFDSNKRKSKQIKFLIFHYTGMIKESDAISRLTNIQSEVSSHYLIQRNGTINLMVPDLYVAWHAGKSSWKGFKSLNKNSIGIEISNPGHEHTYINFSKKQIKSILYLSKSLMKKYKIQSSNMLGHSDIAPFRKKDPGEKFPWKYLAKFGIGKWHSLSNKILKKNRMKKIHINEEKIFYKSLFKIGYSKKILNKKTLVSAFQRRYRQDLINGKIDQECLLISENLAK